MKTYLLKPMVVVCLCLLTASFTFAADNYKMVKVKAPFPMQPIKVFIYPDKDFLITDYGAKNGGKVNNTKAIAAAIEAVSYTHLKRISDQSIGAYYRKVLGGRTCSSFCR